DDDDFQRIMQGDRGEGVALHDALEVVVVSKAGLLPDLGDREDHQDGVERVERQEVDQDALVRDVDELSHAAYSASAWGDRPRTSRAIWRGRGAPPVSASSS